MSEAAVAADDGKILCQIDGAKCHSVSLHIKNNHPDWTLERYRAEYPDAPVLSEYAKAMVMKRKAEQKAETSMTATGAEFTREPFHIVFDLGSAKAAKNARGEDILIKVMANNDDLAASLVPDVDPNYIFNIEEAKNAIIGLELAMAHYRWGYHGTGKTSSFEQICARTKRPFLRIQHTANTEESHILGQWTVKDGNTVWQAGPLMEAMLHGWVYCADEYDFAMPNVVAVYQPVLEGKPLVVKDAPPELRMVRPHANFRFCATGNTNGGGDETGLYQGTQMQNAANYSRFGIVEEIGYMAPDVEALVVASQSGIRKEDAEKLIKFATDIRDSFKGSRIGVTISPRELIACARLGMVRGSDWLAGVKLGFTNRCSRVDKEVIDQFAQRIFGGKA